MRASGWAPGIVRVGGGCTADVVGGEGEVGAFVEALFHEADVAGADGLEHHRLVPSGDGPVEGVLHLETVCHA